MTEPDVREALARMIDPEAKPWREDCSYKAVVRWKAASSRADSLLAAGWRPGPPPGEVEALRAEVARLREGLADAQRWLCRAHDRIHCLPRTSDSTLGRELDLAQGRARALLAQTNPQDQAGRGVR